MTGETLYNMIKLDEGEVDANDRPLHPPRIIRAEVLLNPFDDIVPRPKKQPEPEKKKKDKGVKYASPAAATLQ